MAGCGMACTPLRVLALIAIGVGAGLVDMSMRGGRIILAKDRPDPVAPVPVPNPNPNPDSSSPTPAPVDALPGAAQGAIRDIGIAEAKEWYDKGAMFLDARPRRDSEREGRIPGSQLLGPGDVDRNPPPEILDVLDPEKEVVIYCIGGDCYDSHNLAAMLEARGFTKLMVLAEGFPAWVKAGYEVDKSPLPPE